MGGDEQGLAVFSGKTNIAWHSGVLVLVALFPDVITWLPNLVYGKFG